MVHFSEVSLGGHEPINRLNVTIKGPINSTILVIVLMLNSLLSISQNFDFRKTRWGMTMEDVKNNEYSTLGLEDKKTSNLIYETTLNRYKVGLKYHFVNNKLAFCIYFFFMNDFIDCGIKWLNNHRRQTLRPDQGVPIIDFITSNPSLR